MVEDLLEGNEALGLETDVDDDVLVGDLDDGAGDDDLFGGQVLGGGGLGGLLAVEVRECCGEVCCVVVRLVHRRRQLSAWRRAPWIGCVLGGLTLQSCVLGRGGGGFRRQVGVIRCRFGR